MRLDLAPILPLMLCIVFARSDAHLVTIRFMLKLDEKGVKLRFFFTNRAMLVMMVCEWDMEQTISKSTKEAVYFIIQRSIPIFNSIPPLVDGK